MTLSTDACNATDSLRDALRARPPSALPCAQPSWATEPPTVDTLAPALELRLGAAGDAGAPGVKSDSASGARDRWVIGAKLTRMAPAITPANMPTAAASNASG